MSKSPRLPAGVAPGTLLLVAPQAQALADYYRSELPDCTITTLSPDGALQALRQHSGRYDLAILYEALEQLDGDQASALLAHLRDLAAARVLVSVRPNAATHCQRDPLAALGFRQLDTHNENGQQIAVFDFNLRDYKSTPDWLNARFWANPALWDRFRW
jgi:hypothetical protein